MRACRTLGAVEYDEFESHDARSRIGSSLTPTFPGKKGTFAKRSTRWTEFMGQHWFQLRRSVGTPRRSDRSDVPRGAPRCRPFIRFAWRRRLW